MTITASSRSVFAISTDNGSTWTNFPVGPYQMTPIRAYDTPKRLGGSRQQPMFWDIQVSIKTLLHSQFRVFTNLWAVNKQHILLNYPSGKFYGLGATGTSSSGWVYAPANWNSPPIESTTQRGTIIIYEMQITFERVEYDAVNPLS